MLSNKVVHNCIAKPQRQYILDVWDTRHKVPKESIQLTFCRPRRNFMALAMEEQQAAISAYSTRSVGNTSTPVAQTCKNSSADAAVTCVPWAER